MQDRVYQTPDLEQCLTDTWNGLSQSIVHDTVDELRKRLSACVKEKGTFLTFAVTTERQLACAVKRGGVFECATIMF